MKTLLPAAMIFCGLFNTIELALAQTWTETRAPSNLNWTSVASSADASKLVAVVNGGGIYTSTNFGGDWVQQTNAPHLPWYSVASSADGNYLVATERNQINYPPGYADGIFTSTNAGVTWTSNNVPFSVGPVVSSADGSKLAVSSGFSIFTSTNFGISWTSNSVLPGYAIISCASSADGTKLIVGHESGPISISTNSGTTWTQVLKSLDSGGWWSVASSADGGTLVAYSPAGGDGPAGNLYTSSIFISTNFGITWTSNQVSRFRQYVASSADGVKLAAAVAASGIYTSTNSGMSWVSNNVPNENWNFISSSADGNELIATVQGGGIWISKTTPTPSLNISPSDTNLDLSWLIPSTNFALQQNSDLTTTNWLTLTNEPTLNLTNLNDEVTLPQTNSRGFFRLIAQ